MPSRYGSKLAAAMFAIVVCAFAFGAIPYLRLPTKADWLQKADEEFGIVRFGSGPVTADRFVRVMGKPDRTQSIGPYDGYWYYECRDGVIQIEHGPQYLPDVFFVKRINSF